MESSAGAGSVEAPVATGRALRTLSAVLLRHVPALTDRLTEMLRRREPCYIELSGADPDGLWDNLRDNMECGLRTLGEALPDGADPLGTSRHTGRLRASQQVPLEVVLRAYRLGGRVIWEALLATSREEFAGRYDHALLDAAGHVWRVIDAGSAALADAYRREETRLREQESSRRQALFTALLDGMGADPDIAEEAAGTLGLPATGRMLCAVSPVETPRHIPLREPRDVLAAHGIASCWQRRPTDIVGLIALAEATPADVLGALSPTVAGRVGVSPVIETLAEVRDAYPLALTAANTLREPGIATLDDRLPEALVTGSPQLAPRLREAAFGDLLNLPAQERETMLRTLETLLDAGGSPTRAAQRLYCHRNTVIYRLHRIETATGRKLTEPRDRLLLSLALIANRL